MNIKIITDSTCYMSREYVKANDITVVPLTYIFEDKIYEEGYSGEFNDYFISLKNSKSFPSTSQPATGDLYKEFEIASKEYDHVIGIFMSSELSGCYNNALLVKDMLQADNITVIDSRSSVAAMRFLIVDIVDMIKDKKSVDEIIARTEENKKKLEVYLTTESLEYLSRGGRLSKIESTMGDILNIKPIVELTNGRLEQIDKVRGKKKAIKNIIDRAPKDCKRIAICHILNNKEAEKLKKELENKYENVEISIEDIGPVIGSHLGPETIGICCYKN